MKDLWSGGKHGFLVDNAIFVFMWIFLNPLTWVAVLIFALAELINALVKGG